MKNLFVSFSIGTIMAILATMFGIKSILFLLIISYVFFCYNNPEKCFWITYFLMLALPLGSGNKIIVYLSITIAGITINMIEAMVIANSIIILIGRKGRKFEINNFINIAFLILVLSYGFYFFIGINKGYKAIWDFKIYIIQILLFYSTYKIIKDSDDVKKLLNITFYASLSNSIITIIMYLTSSWSVWGLNYSGGRFGGNFVTILIISMSYAVFIFYNKSSEVKRWILFVAMIAGMITMFLSQNRSNPILLLISSILIIVVCLFNNRSDRNIIGKISLALILGISILFGVAKFLYGESDFANRYISIIENKDDNNLGTRAKTIEYYSEIIKSKPFGNGFGTTMPFIDSNGNVKYDQSMNVDNSYINIARKCGINTLIIYIIVILSPLFILKRLYKYNKNIIYKQLAISYFMLLIATSILTSQSIHSYAVSSFIWVLISYLNLELVKFKKASVEENYYEKSIDSQCCTN